MNGSSNEGEETVPLLSIESSKALLEESGITSMTFFSGDLDQANIYIRKRFREIVEINPWLAGRIVNNEQHKILQPVCPATPVFETYIEQLFHHDSALITIRSKMSYGPFVRELNRLL